jgi:hypothetical protein
MTAEPIAEVVADIRAGRAHNPLHGKGGTATAATALHRAIQPQPTVDATAIYTGLLDRATGPGINIYDDFPQVTSPWDEASICYINNHGNVIVLQVHSEPWTQERRWQTGNPVDWWRVKWLVETFIWIGGQSASGPLPTTGPVHLLQHAVYADGAPADMHWVQILPPRHQLTEGDHYVRVNALDPTNPNPPAGGDDPTWEMPLAVLNASLNFLSCTNVEVAEPARPRAARRRLGRTGVTVQEIVVRPAGKRTRSSGSRMADAHDTPLTTVRGHFSRYGPEYGRGLLFGKYSGKFWVPGHARGKAGDGEVRDYRDYRLQPKKAS